MYRLYHHYNLIRPKIAMLSSKVTIKVYGKVVSYAQWGDSPLTTSEMKEQYPEATTLNSRLRKPYVDQSNG